MKTIGIICEYNPFHNGHVYHIKKIKELFPDSRIVLVMSGNFTQSGEVSIIDKYQKTALALAYDVDLVLELPYAFATEAADIFAKGAVDILNEMQCDYLVFGSETNDIAFLTKLACRELEDDFGLLVKKYMDDGVSYPNATTMALKYYFPTLKLESNDILGLSYIKEILLLKSKMVPITIKRTNDFKSKNASDNIASATSIRLLLENNKDASKYVPKETLQCLHDLHNNNDYFMLLKYKIISSPDLSIYETVDEGIENRILKYIYEAHNMDELIKMVKSKRSTYNKVSRMFNHILCGFTKEDAKNMKKLQYIRILGFNSTGKKIIKECKKDVSVPIISRYQKGYPMLDLELRTSKIYNLFTNDELEYKKKPIIK